MGGFILHISDNISFHVKMGLGGGTVIDPFGHITPIIHIISIRVHQTLIQLLHALEKSPP